MRLCTGILTCLILLNVNAVFAQSDNSGAKPSSKKEPTVFIGEFEYAVSSLGKPTLGEVAGRDTLQTIATFIYERQPLELKHVELLERHRDDLAHLLKDDSRKTEAALLLMWMNKQAGNVDNELVQYFAGIDQNRFRRAYRLANSLDLKFYKTFEMVMAARRFSGYHDDKHAYAERESLDEKFGTNKADGFDHSKIESIGDAELMDLYSKFLFPEPMLRLRDRERWLQEHLSPQARINFKATLDLVLDDSLTIEARKSKAAVILWEIVDFPNLEQDKIDMLADAREQLADMFRSLKSEPELRGMLASLLVWANEHAKTQCVECREALKALSSMELNLLMLYAPLMHLQSGNDFQQIVADHFKNCDEDTAQMIIDVLGRYADSNDLELGNAIDLIANLKERPQISAPQLKQLLTILVDLNAKVASNAEQLEETTANADPKLDALELRRKEAELKVKELEQQRDELDRLRKLRLR